MKKGGKMPSIEIEGQSEKEFVLREGIIMPIDEAQRLDAMEQRQATPADRAESRAEDWDLFEGERRREAEEDQALRSWREETAEARRR